jgi:antitoxin CptB
VEHEIKRLRWQCRRGMLELDVLLGRFLDNKYSTLPSDQRTLFKQLLTENDQDLFMWLTAKDRPAQVAYQPLIDRIRG